MATKKQLAALKKARLALRKKSARKSKARKSAGALKAVKTSLKRKTGLRQTKVRGSSITRDAARKAKKPGKRKSKSGRTYYERRENRSDMSRKRGL